MQHVANLELSKELYEVSGWDDTYWCYFNTARGDLPPDGVVTRTPYKKFKRIMAPAYDLGYLLRKLPHGEPGNERFMLTLSPDWLICYEQLTIEGYADYGAVHFHHEADTPEDSTCKLAIELFRQGVLTKKPGARSSGQR